MTRYESLDEHQFREVSTIFRSLDNHLWNLKGATESVRLLLQRVKHYPAGVSKEIDLIESNLPLESSIKTIEELVSKVIEGLQHESNERYSKRE